MLRRPGLTSFTCPVLVFVLTFDLTAQAPASTIVKIPDGTMLRLALEKGRLTEA